MNLTFFFFVGFLILACIIGLVIYFVRLSTREQADPSNPAFLDSFMPQYSNGYSFGVIDDIQTSATTTKITFYPRDEDLIKIANSKEGQIVKPQKIYVLNKNVDFKPAGSWSSRRNRIKVFPPLIEEIPEGLREEWVIKRVSENEVEYKHETQYRAIIESQSKIQETELPHRMVERHLEDINDAKKLREPAQTPEVK